MVIARWSRYIEANEEIERQFSSSGKLFEKAIIVAV